MVQSSPIDWYRVARNAQAILNEARRDRHPTRIRRHVREVVAALQGHGNTNPRRTLITPQPLTDREIQVLARVSRGQTNVSMAAALHLSTSTVNNVTVTINDKLGAVNRPHAIAIAYHLGLLP